MAKQILPPPLPDGLPKIIVGLGNPGSKYFATRHNFGYLLLDEALEQLEKKGCFPEKNNAFRELALVWNISFLGERIIFLKPKTFMNLSGKAVAKVLRASNLELKDLLVLHDDLELPLGSMRIKFSGGLAGHNGLRSIASLCGGADFFRLRLGIGRPEFGQDVTSHVLSKFFPQEMELVKETVDNGAEVILSFLEHGALEAQKILDS